MFVDINSVSENPEEAKAIANGVAEAYRQFRLEQQRAGNLGGLKALEERFAEQDERVRKAQSEVDRLRERFNIQNVVASADSPTASMSAEMLGKLDGMRIELEAQVMKEGTMLDYLKAIPREKLIYTIPSAAPDSILKTFLEQKSLCEQSLIAKLKDYGVEHPEVVIVRSQLEDLKTRIDNQVDGILLGMDSHVSAVKEQLKKLKDEVEKARANDIATAKLTQPYWEAKRRLEELQQFRQVLEMKIASENIEAALPKKPTVEITSLAETPRGPSSPNRPQAAGLILFGILLDFSGLRMIKAKPRMMPVLQPS